ncbi:hypothetical protein PILCRDRAFT_7026 [Piloderma croceum F 1598]|uniref:Uncharacterized protein n=1 Tax=Piloderma croceum (strain F 1598) TaxID=765440 RepID=A0A0C3BBG4_PILCF|nr:hypothetical protein PILCRDRAFT_7026 [Piloderma croceum F 1598]
MAGLHLQRPSVEWKFDILGASQPQESLRTVWWIHASVAFKAKGYIPKATFICNQSSPKWEELVGKGPSLTSHGSGLGDWEQYLEMDLFDHTAGSSAIQRLADRNLTSEDRLYVLKRLDFMAMSEAGSNTICREPRAVTTLAEYISNDSNATDIRNFAAGTLEKLISYVTLFENNNDRIAGNAVDACETWYIFCQSLLSLGRVSIKKIRNENKGAQGSAAILRALAQYSAFSFNLIELLLTSDNDLTRGSAAGLLQTLVQYKSSRAVMIQTNVLVPLFDILKSDNEGTRGSVTNVIKTFAISPDLSRAMIQAGMLPLFLDILQRD